MKRIAGWVSAMVLLACAASSAGESGLKVKQDPAEYAAAMKAVAAKFKGTPGVFLHIGDSITYANQNTRWAGKMGCGGGSAADQAFAKWTHAGDKNDKDGWFLAYTDCPGNRSETACSGIRADEYNAGGKSGMAPLADILKKYNPQIALYMLGTNDISAGRAPDAYSKDVETAMDALLANGTIPILSTLPPYRGKSDKVDAYNKALRELAKKKKIPLLDLNEEMKARAGADAEKNYLSGDGIHLSGDQAGGPPTDENLKICGYFLRCYTAVQKGIEVKAAVIDAK